MTGLTRVQRKVLDFIRDYIMEHGCSPTFREIGHDLGISSPGNVHQHIRNLVQRGAITIVRRRRRSIALCESTLTIALPPSIDQEVRRIAAEAGTTPEAVVVECVRDGLSRVRSLSVTRGTSRAA